MVVSLAVGACGDGEAGPRAATRDSAGITIVENRLPADARLPWTVAPEPALVIGAAEGEADRQLYQVRGARRLSDGRTVVANAGTRELRVFGPDGAFLGAAGGEGGGPGEFRSMALVGVLPGDSILLYDSRSRRFSVLTSDPAFVRSFGPAPEVGGSVRPRGLLADGRIVADGPAATGELVSGTVLDPVRPLLVLGPDGGLREVIDSASGRPTFFESDQGYSFTSVPFTLTPPRAVGDTLVHAGAGRPYEIRTYHADTGSLVRIARLERAARPVTDADIERGIDEGLGRVADDAARARLRTSYEAMPLPDTMPFYRAFVVDRAGHLWVEDYRAHAGDPHRWTVFDPDGAALGTLTLPDGLTVYEIGADWILGLRRDELDIPYVVLYRLERTPTG